MESADSVNVVGVNQQLPTKLFVNEALKKHNAVINEVWQDEEMKDAAKLNRDKIVTDDLKERAGDTFTAKSGTDGNSKSVDAAAKHVDKGTSPANQHEPITPISLVRNSPAKAEDHSGETIKVVFTPAALPLVGETDDGTPEEQVAFMKEIESFYRERAMDFKLPKFYGKPLNCLKLWRVVIRLGGYDRSLLEYERHKTQSGELQLPVPSTPEASGADVEGDGHHGLGSGKVKRDSAARAMQNWHVQRPFGHGEVGEPVRKAHSNRRG